MPILGVAIIGVAMAIIYYKQSKTKEEPTNQTEGGHENELGEYED